MVIFRNRPTTPLVFHCRSSNPQQFHWYHFDPDGSLHTGDQETPLPAAPHGEVILLIPASQVLFTRAVADHLHRQTLNWQFEEIALVEPEALHTIILAHEQQHAELAAVDKQWLQQALDSINALGVKVTRALPDVLTLPVGQGIFLESQWLIRTQPWRGICASQTDLTLLQELDPTLETVELCSQAGAEVLITGATENRINFLQGKFTPKFSLHTPCRLLTAGLLCCALSLLVPPLVSGWLATLAANDLQRQTWQIFTTHYPQERPTNPERQFSKNLNALVSTPTPDGLLLLLADSAAALATLEGNPLQTLVWDENQQQIRLSFSRELPATLPFVHGVNIQIQGQDILISRE